MSAEAPSTFRFKLTDEQRRIVATVRELTQNEFKARGLQYMNGAFPWENIRSLAELGILGMAVPEAYGGSEFAVFDTALVLEEIAKGCYVTAMAVLGEVGVQTRIIATYAPEPIKRRLLPAVCTGDCILAICMTEPQAGTDVANYATNAVVHGATVRLKGVKTLVSRAEEAGAFVVFTRVNGRPGRDGIGCILVESGMPGLVLAGKFHTMGGEYLHEVRFEDCELPADNLLLGEGGFKTLLAAFNTQRCLNPAISLGLAEGAFDEALRYARERVAFGRPIGEFQGHALEARNDVPRDRSSARPALSRLRHRRSVPRPPASSNSQGLLQRNVGARHERGLAGLRRVRLHRRVSRVAALSRRALWQPRRRDLRNVARPDRKAFDGNRCRGRHFRSVRFLSDFATIAQDGGGVHGRRNDIAA
jgi:alkylation response protein AidB-like acyl-CoA dehydrogenase